MNTATATQPRSTVHLSTPPFVGHVWTEEELRAKCITVDESQRDLEKMMVRRTAAFTMLSDKQ